MTMELREVADVVESMWLESLVRAERSEVRTSSWSCCK